MNCPICHSHDATVAFRLRTYRIVRCAGCRLLYNRDFPEASQVTETFSESYYHDVQRDAFARIAEPLADLSRPIYDAGLAYVEARGRVGTLLDVGCAFGVFMEIAAHRGWQVKGVEVSAYASRYAREVRGLDVTTGSGAEFDAAPGSFDLVTLWDVLEHVRDAQATVQAAARWLKPGGYLLVTTDNYRSLLSRIANFAYRATMGVATYPIERFYIPFNTCYFTSDDVSSLMSREGLKVEYSKGIDYPIEKIKLSAAERLVLKTLYSAGDMLGQNTQFMMIARKNG